MAIVIQSKQPKGKEKNEKSSQLVPSANVTPPLPLLLIPLLYYITGESAVYGNNDRDIFARNRLFRRRQTEKKKSPSALPMYCICVYGNLRNLID